jgi:hypothetical protein
MTFAQAKEQANKALRAARRSYRKADTAGEIVERTLDRLISKRKTIVTPAQMMPLLQRYEDYARRVLVLEAALAVMMIRLTKYLL